MPIWIVVAVIVVLVFLGVGAYNGLVQLKVRADSSWSDIDIQLKRRHDLIPNIVETVKGYATHEKETFENIARFRSAAQEAHGPEAQGAAEGQLTTALRGLLMVQEAYPALKADAQFQNLTNTLTDLEDAIQNSRRYYNAVVRDLNTRILSFPTSIIASYGHFEQRQFFELESAADRQTPTVKF